MYIQTQSMMFSIATLQGWSCSPPGGLNDTEGCQLKMLPWRVCCCWDWAQSLAFSIFLLKRHWNNMSSSGSVVDAKFGMTPGGFMRPGIWGLRTGSSTLTGTEKSELPRPSEVTGTDSSLRVPSLFGERKTIDLLFNKFIQLLLLYICYFLVFVPSQQKSSGSLL